MTSSSWLWKGPRRPRSASTELRASRSYHRRLVWIWTAAKRVAQCIHLPLLFLSIPVLNQSKCSVFISIYLKLCFLCTASKTLHRLGIPVLETWSLQNSQKFRVPVSVCRSSLSVILYGWSWFYESKCVPGVDIRCREKSCSKAVTYNLLLKVYIPAWAIETLDTRFTRGKSQLKNFDIFRGCFPPPPPKNSPSMFRSKVQINVNSKIEKKFGASSVCVVHPDTSRSTWIKSWLKWLSLEKTSTILLQKPNFNRGGGRS